MRLTQPGIARRGLGFTFSFEGDPIEAFPGESIAAALVSANRLGCREGKNGDPRGVFCGMGVCGECSVLVDGYPRRACMEMAQPGLSVARQPARRKFPEPDAEGGSLPEESPVRDVEVLVVGAGPAGLAAARSAALCGAGVLLVDERGKAGGQYFKQPGQGFDVDERRIDPQFREGIELYRSAVEAGVEFCFGATVWGAFPGPGVAVATSSGSQILRPQRIIVSPGAYERPMPFPGWTLPGVMTTGAAQTLLRAYQTAPGRRVLVAGNGPLNLQVARELDAAGAEVVAVLELSSAPGLSKASDLLRMCLSSPGLVGDGIGHVLRLARSRVPVLYEHVLVGAQGEDRVAGASVARIDATGALIPGSERHFAVDAVCMGYGFLGQSEIARALGAGHSPAATLADVAALGDISGRSDAVPAVFIVGDARGLGGARIAISQGSLAGAEAAADLGYRADAESGRARGKNLRALRRHRRFQRALWSVYQAPAMGLGLAQSDTIVCRCESVTRGQIAELVSAGVSSIGAIKRETRAGMGRCQGRYCAGLVLQMVSDPTVSPAEEQAFFAPRPPFKPLAIASLAAAFDASATFDRSAGAREGSAGEFP